MLQIESVERGCIGEEMGLEKGDFILSVNSKTVEDPIDFVFYTQHSTSSDEYTLFEVRKKDGSCLEIEAELDEGDDLGLRFPPIEPLRCRNNCIFCFVHQLPRGLRRTLYIKDEDYRLSFLNGNYVTLSQIDRSDIDRIKEQRLSPLYISVHSTDPDIRERLLGKRPKWNITELMDEFASAGLEMHTQIVICPGINDGTELEKTLKDLFTLYPGVLSVAVVPVGLSSHRERLPDVRPVDRIEAAKTIREVEVLQKRFRNAGSAFVFLADEYYVKAGLDIPPYTHYEDFPQIGNGVGLLAMFNKEARQVLAGSGRMKRPIRASVITGLSPRRYIEEFIQRVNSKLGTQIMVYPVENRLFGNSVTVTGLLSGEDIANRLNGENLGEFLLVPDIVLRDGEDMFLDDLTVEEMEKKLGVKVLLFDSTPTDFIEKIRSN